MEWKHLPKEIKKEILSWATDTRTFRGERDTIIRGGLFYVCKEFQELLISISGWGWGSFLLRLIWFGYRHFNIILSNDKTKNSLVLFFKNSLVIMESLSKYPISGLHSLLGVKETSSGIVSLISSSKNIYLVILDSDKKDARALIESEKDEINLYP